MPLTSPLMSTASTNFKRQAELVDKQLILELNAVRRGVERYRRLMREVIERGDGASLKPAERLELGWYKEVVSQINMEKSALLRGESAPFRSKYGPFLPLVKTQHLAVMTLHEMIGMTMPSAGQKCIATGGIAYGGVPLRNVAENIGRAANAQCNLPKIKRDETATKALNKASRKEPKPYHILKVTRKHIPNENWGRSAHIQLGMVLVKLAMMAAAVEAERDGKKKVEPAFRFHTLRTGKKSKVKLLVMNDAVADMIEEGHSLRQHLRPRYGFMVCPPPDWTVEGDGGYLTLKTQMVKRSTSWNAKPDRSGLDRVMAGTNALGKTAWRLNKGVAKVVEYLWEAGGGYAGIPRKFDCDRPPRPQEFANEDEKKAWNKAASAIHRKNVGLRADRMNFHYKLNAMREAEEYEAIYFPHQLDFRGRAYPMPLFWNHQGDDVCRGTLEFARAVPLTEDGLRWLKIHTANCCGIDKVSFDQRVEWVDGSMKTLMGWAKDPIENTGWMEHDKPFQALAAAMALADPEAAAHLPIQLDGTCNGLQHYAALGRDPSGASAVNLIDHPAPADVYAAIAERVSKQAANDVDRTDEIKVRKSETMIAGDIAKELDGVINRKVAKPVVMTTVYGVTAIGARAQVYEKLEEAGVRKEMLYPCSIYLANTTLKAVKKVCVSAGRIMDWIRECAKLIVKKGRQVAWENPLGLTVVQPDMRPGPNMRIATCLQEINLASKSTRPAIRRQVNGASPNIIHSIDMAHMMLVAVECLRADVDFAGVHDSNWAHASNIPFLNRAIRAKFVELHELPIIQTLYEDWCHLHEDIKFPPPPVPGDFDIREVLNATYFFG